MKITELSRSQIDFSRIMAKNGLNSDNLSDLSFSTLIKIIIDDKAVSAKESVEEEKSEISCDCDKDEVKCACDSEKDIKAILESEDKSGLDACMDCDYRKSGQCDLWNGEDGNDPFAIITGSSRDNSTASGVAKLSDVQANLDIMAMASLQFDYTNAYAYAYVQKKVKHTDNGWIE